MSAPRDILVSEFGNPPSGTLTEAEVLAWLTLRVEEMLLHRRGYLMSLCYTLDLSEREVTASLDSVAPAHPARCLARLLYERQRARMLTKHTFSPPSLDHLEMPGKPSLRDRIDGRTEYAETLSGPVPDYLERIERQTHLRTIAPQMMSGRLQGRILAMIAALQRPRRVLEIGTFTGYGTLCLAEGLPPDGHIDTIEGDPEVAGLARRHFATSPFAEQITLHLAQAAAVLSMLPGPYDLIFLDADKQGYPEYFLLMMERLAPGGLLLADNVLWDGKVGTKNRDADTNALAEYNRLVAEDQRLNVVVLQIRDGLSVARRVK